MLPSGTISKIIEYYFSSPSHRSEMKRALAEFLEGGRMTEYGGGLFNEWLVYDFVLEGGYTPLEEFIAKNPLALPETELSVYRDLHENIYALFEVMSVKRRKGMTLKDARAGTRWHVEEDKATRSLHAGDLFFGRIAKVADHYELIGADSVLLSDADAKAAKKHFGHAKIRLTPKVAHNWLRERFEIR